MSLPVTRRIARAALLVAAGAAPVVGAAGTASAAALPAKAPDLVGGLTAPLDSRNTNKALDHAAHDGAGVLNTTGKKAVTKLAPALVETAAPAVKKVLPITHGAAQKAEGTARPFTKDGITTNKLPVDAAMGLAGQALLGGLPVGR
ncbi:ATP-binding protein [Streptomyces sp. NPDC059008]|uniref:ATP-binding protein n=1 Tax=unclassified Streptomyces TaxID=2593676 RepID=UPI00367CEBC6